MKTNNKMNIKEVYKKFPELKKLAQMGLKYLDGASHELNIKDEEAGIEFGVKNISLVHDEEDSEKSVAEDYEFENCYVVKGRKKVLIFGEQDEVSNDEFLTYLAKTFYESKEYKTLIDAYDAARSAQKKFEEKYGVDIYFDGGVDNPIVICPKDDEYDYPILEINTENGTVDDMTEEYNKWAEQKVENLKEKRNEIDELIKSMKVIKI